jgi:hypothetical protein
MPQPPGWFVKQWNGRMAQKAQADAFVVYCHEWHAGGHRLGHYGLYHVAQMARRLPHEDFPVLIQVGGPPALNEARRRTLIEALQAKGVVDAPHRVLLAFPEAEGLRYHDLPHPCGPCLPGAFTAFPGFGPAGVMGSVRGY